MVYHCLISFLSGFELKVNLNGINLQISMLILGKNKILPIFKTMKATPRQQLLKSIAQFIPRCERCTCDECEVFSGIFGNTFWHENVSPSMHHWLNKVIYQGFPWQLFLPSEKSATMVLSWTAMEKTHI